MLQQSSVQGGSRGQDGGVKGWEGEGVNRWPIVAEHSLSWVLVLDSLISDDVGDMDGAQAESSSVG